MTTPGGCLEAAAGRLCPGLPARHAHGGVGWAIFGHFFSKSQWTSLSESWHFWHAWSICSRRWFFSASVSFGLAFHGFISACHLSSLGCLTCSLAGPWQLSQPTSFSFGVRPRSVKPLL